MLIQWAVGVQQVLHHNQLDAHLWNNKPTSTRQRETVCVCLCADQGGCVSLAGGLMWVISACEHKVPRALSSFTFIQPLIRPSCSHQVYVMTCSRGRDMRLHYSWISFVSDLCVIMIPICHSFPTIPCNYDASRAKNAFNWEKMEQIHFANYWLLNCPWRHMCLLITAATWD